MNLSRAYTLSARRQGHRVVFPIGRVKTPTLALVVRRQRELDDFVPVTYYVVKADFQHKNGIIRAQWQPKDTQAGLDPEGAAFRKKRPKTSCPAWLPILTEPSSKTRSPRRRRPSACLIPVVAAGPGRQALRLHAPAGPRYGPDPVRTETDDLSPFGLRIPAP